MLWLPFADSGPAGFWAKLGLNGGSTFEDGACQLWRMVPEAQRID